MARDPEVARRSSEICSGASNMDFRAISRSSGSSPALTVAGEIDLGTPGYSVSLARDPADAPGANEARLVLTLAPASGMVTQVVTAHAVRYFGPAPNAITQVHIACDGQDITSIAVTAE